MVSVEAKAVRGEMIREFQSGDLVALDGSPLVEIGPIPHIEIQDVDVKSLPSGEDYVDIGVSILDL